MHILNRGSGACSKTLGRGLVFRDSCGKDRKRVGIEAALKKAWEGLEKAGKNGAQKVRFLGEEYLAEPDKKHILRVSDGSKTSDYHSLLLLHYLENEGSAPQAGGDWISFNDLEGGSFYYQVFRARAAERVARKFTNNVLDLYKNMDKIDGEKAQLADASIVVKAFEKVPVAVLVWQGDEELPGEANILFKSNIRQIFSTEGVAVLAEIVASRL